MKTCLNIIYIFLFLILTCNYSYSQQDQDTLDLARELRNKDDYKGAATLLNNYVKNHPVDVNALWLLGQTQFWLGNLKTSIKLYEKALWLDPDNDYLQLDYAKSLTDMGEWKRSTSILNKLEANGKNYSDGDYIRAKILYWKWDYNKSKKLLDNALYKDGSNAAAHSLLKEVLAARSPWLKFNAFYINDNQPLKNQTTSIETGKFFSPYANLFLGIYLPVFRINGSNSNAFWIQSGNKAFFSDIRLLLQTDAGIVIYPYNSKTDWTANIYVKKNFNDHLLLDAQAKHIPYFNTITSIDTNLSFYDLSASVSWDDKNSFNGKAGIEYNLYPKNKYVYSLYAWVYAPPLKFSEIELKLGYAYNFSNSNYNTFIPVNSTDQIIQNYSSTTYIEGIYDPYFSPKNQFINSGLGSVTYDPLKFLKLGLNVNIGFYSGTKNPYLYLNSDSGGQIIVDKSYSQEKFYPADIEFYIDYRMTNKMDLQFRYEYLSTYFYISRYFGINYRISFWNE